MNRDIRTREGRFLACKDLAPDFKIEVRILAERICLVGSATKGGHVFQHACPMNGPALGIVLGEMLKMLGNEKLNQIFNEMQRGRSEERNEMNPETGRIQTKPETMSPEDWKTYCKAHGLVPMTDDEFKRLAPLKPTQRAKHATQLKAYDPAKHATAKLIEERKKATRRLKSKASRQARKRA